MTIGCAPEHVTPTTQPYSAVTIDTTAGRECAEYRTDAVFPTSSPAALVMHHQAGLARCQCAYTTSVPYGCGRECESAYDLGTTNRETCDYTASDEPLTSVNASVDRTDCSVALLPDSTDDQAYLVSVRCASPGDALVTVSGVSTSGPAVGQALITFTASGECPHAIPTSPRRQ
jgi:hypothetical protein